MRECTGNDRNPYLCTVLPPPVLFQTIEFSMRRLSLLTVTFLLLCGTLTLQAQPVVGADGAVGIGTDYPDASSLLDLTSTTLGFLMPRMTTVQRDLIPAPAEGLMIYNTDLGLPQLFSNASGLWQWDGVVTTGSTLGWLTAGNSGLTDGVDNFLGTNDPVRVRMVVGGVENLVMNTNGSLQRDLGGNARGTNAVDLQTFRANPTEVASGQGAFLGSGGNNTASGTNAFVGAGAGNAVTALNASLVGGFQNSVTAVDGFIGGGVRNLVSGSRSVVVGGLQDSASGDHSFIGGGYNNDATGPRSTIAGGWANRASENATTVGGGADNLASGAYSTVSGGNQDTASNTDATVGGGFRNHASGVRSTIAGGAFNRTTGTITTVGGGENNSAGSIGGTVAGGRDNSAVFYSAVGGGLGNSTSSGATVAGGFFNRAYNLVGAVGGGEYNEAGYHSAIPGGRGLRVGSGSFGFLGGNPSTPGNSISPGDNPMTITTPDVAVFGNTDLWLANNNNGASQLRFYEAYGTPGAFPNTANYTAFVAGAQGGNIVYTLPTALPVAGQILQASAVAGSNVTLTWANDATVARRDDNGGGSNSISAPIEDGTGETIEVRTEDFEALLREVRELRAIVESHEQQLNQEATVLNEEDLTTTESD